MSMNDMVLMTIETQTKPDVPNANGIIYSKKVYDDIVKQMEEQSRYIPIVKEPTQGFCMGKMPGTLDLSKINNEELGCKLLGSVTKICDDNITIHAEKQYEDMINELVRDGYKASMVYCANIENNIVTNIHHILYFSLDKVNR